MQKYSAVVWGRAFWMGQGLLNMNSMWMVNKLSVSGEKYPEKFYTIFSSSWLQELRELLNQFNRPYVNESNVNLVVTSGKNSGWNGKGIKLFRKLLVKDSLILIKFSKKLTKCNLNDFLIKF